MEHMDEEILKQKKLLRQQEEKRSSAESMEQEAGESIYDEVVHIIGKETHFGQRQIPELGISICMPETFFMLTDDIRGIIYPAGNAPSHVFAGEDIPFQLAVSMTEHLIPEERMKDFMKQTAKVLEAVGPKVKITETSVEEKEQFRIGIMEFASRAADMTVYNIQFCVSRENGLLMGTVNFPGKYRKRMAPLAKQIIQSLEIIKEETDGINHIS